MAPYDDPDPAIPPMTLQQRIDLADADLREARDLYAFLAVYAPVTRMRADDGQDLTTWLPKITRFSTLRPARRPQSSRPNSYGSGA
ncbi:MAG: hypothetical protein H6668_16325 [Ardenticatenaceae bacterium]|nr:hypothetical protein [Ardenticatenaceae bacterium]